MLKVAVLVSGSGSNLQSILDYGQTSFKVEMVIGSKEGIYALERAKNKNIPTYVVSKEEYGSEISNKILELTKNRVDLIVLAGYLKIITPKFVDEFRNKIINIHPSLLPKYGGKGMYGVKVQEAVLRNHEKYAGCTVHYVDSEIDTGEIIAQKKILVMENESAWELGGRVFNEEIILLPLAIKHIREAMKVIP